MPLARMGKSAAGDVTRFAADGNGGVEPRKHLASNGKRIQIRNQRLARPARMRPPLCRSDIAWQAMRQGIGQARRPAGEAPDRDADADQHPSRVTVRQPAENRRQQHVRHEKCQDEPSDGRAADAKLSRTVSCTE